MAEQKPKKLRTEHQNQTRYHDENNQHGIERRDQRHAGNIRFTG